MEDLRTASKQIHEYLLHLDRLIITYATVNNAINNVSDSFSTNSFEFIYDNQSVDRYYLRNYKVYNQGIYIGTLRTKNKLKNPYVEFEFNKQIFYYDSKNLWYRLALKIENELNIKFNNIRYAEIALDSLKKFFELAYELYHNSTKHKGCKNPIYEQVNKNIPVSILHDENQIKIGGSTKSIVIYNKSNYAEDYIKEFFANNGLTGNSVNRLECRFDSKYLSTFQTNRDIRVDLKSLADDGTLAEIFLLFVKTNLEYKDLRTKRYNNNRNVEYDRVSIIDGFDFETKNLEKFNASFRTSHYKNDKSMDAIRLLYYDYLDNDNIKLKDIKRLAKRYKIKKNELLSLLKKWDKNYNGSKTKSIKAKMNYAINYINSSRFRCLGISIIHFFL
ncbi:MAG: hypothetical protein ACOCP4_01785 [Candidatus Woesearchaeota archaeon]